MLVCTRCKVSKPASEYHKDTRKSNGLSSWCKPCSSFAANRWNRANRARAAETRKSSRENWTQERWEAHRATNRARYHRNKSHLASAQLVRKYGISTQEKDELLAVQNGKCPICETESPTIKGWAVDHDHNTGKVRGILCSVCNISLGGFRDDPKLLRKAAEYLENT